MRALGPFGSIFGRGGLSFRGGGVAPSDPVLLETNHSEIVPNRAKDSHRPAVHETSLLGTSE